MAEFSSGARSSEVAPRFDLIPRCALERLAARLQFGAERHGENNYQKGLGDAQYRRDRVNHLVSHALNLANGDASDDHLGAILANAVMLAWFETHWPESRTFDEARMDPRPCDRCGRHVTRPEQCPGESCPFNR